jgi:uncharacterized protein
MMRALLLFVMCISPAAAQEIPFLSGRVNDYAGMLSSASMRDLEAQLKTHQQQTSNQVVVLTVPSLEGNAIEEFSIRVTEAWKLGQKDKDNGVLFLIARDDRKLRIEVGDGLEGTLTDARCSQIIRHEVVPRFKNGDIDGGITAGVTAILGTIEGTYVGDEALDAADGGFESIGEKLLGLGIFGFVVGIFTIIALAQPKGVGWFLYVFLIPFWVAFPWAILGTLIPGIVYIIGFPILKALLGNNPTVKRWATAMATSRGGSGWTSGGGWSSGGGGFSGGGFSGGGGSFSGGGSSGSW